MSEENQNLYGYESDEVKKSPFSFGLNQAVCTLKTFGWIPNGGKDGAEQEALDIVFIINGEEKGYRRFPITKAFDADGNETDDPEAKRKAAAEQNAVIMHVLGCFVEKEAIKAALFKPIANFKEFCDICQSLLPKGFETKVLDIFLQYQWQIKSGQSRTYLEIPKNMKHGRWLTPTVEGKFEVSRKESPSNDDNYALVYQTESGDKHPFVRSGWYINSSFATYQSEDNEEEVTEETTETVGDAPQGENTAKGWD